ncbi:hypothetical protein B9Q01_08235 [Candidatus Marsarchaeota G1 archaeon OSP_D]|jgi:Enoyl-CoA hydratase/carnithine racemase|uniref:Enoyl-CoA hydratase n=2 Tax=Candidatus Marsarchaeota group 1 TaxID=2203770 RepID=A0A2R6A7R5_9ARCH|nr:MAG: hypothetical protein B9Q01_08235 [Candidatus Marsarchaeota G1 archaeon OSP_D]PSN87170.1 MAG: hypothetical protein B9Q00_09570 [Candidatus Marsarchaeota G1 archaeon OSP_C]
MKVAYITLNTPEVGNLLNNVNKFGKLFSRLKRDKELGIVVLEGNGKDFCLGRVQKKDHKILDKV